MSPLDMELTEGSHKQVQKRMQVFTTEDRQMEESFSPDLC